MMSARETALNVLLAVRKEGGWSNGALKEHILRDGLDRRDAALATRLVYGVLQNRNRLDFYLQQLLTGRVKDLHPGVRDILHMGLYQLFEMDKIPASAAVNESVALAKKYCKKQTYAPGLVNAVLRKAGQGKDRLLQPKSYVDKYSHPQKLVDLLKQEVGKDRLEAMLMANNAAPQTVIQVNTRRITATALTQRLAGEGVEATPHGWMENCLVLSGTGNLEKLPSFRDGLYYVQDPAAKLSVLCAGIPQGAAVLDCCAAPGGKSFAAAMAGAGRIRSCDLHEHKIPLIESGARRLGITELTAHHQDATVFVPAWENAMDVVIVDVPCSGYGIIRKKPDIRDKDPDTMLELPALQLRILKNQARYVRPGGVLLYSTCTLLRRENEQVVEDFLKENKEYSLEKLPLPAIFPENTTGMLTLVPGEYDTDGFFIAKLRRNV
ncbi:MAG: 16S rRNA (cytosine(967)-C(5))-methyltransferase RsmB [Ruminococcaceae bacterium]|nr:16S rRNA (cytosine(967)-C(5))-methyltransferase RsmB [Oscillospiraceae bacterium]